MEVQMQPLSLGWGRSVDGRFAVSLSHGKTILQAYVFSPEEEESLRAFLSGIVVPLSSRPTHPAMEHDENGFH